MPAFYTRCVDPAQKNNVYHVTRNMTPTNWLIGAAAALIIGFSKTGVPGAGILSVPLIAMLFTGRLSTGATLPLLLAADCFAAWWYRPYVRWDKLWPLLPSVLMGFAAGAVGLHLLTTNASAKNTLNIIIGCMVLLMLGIQLLRMKLGERINPTTKAGQNLTGFAGGFSTFVSNAAGPIMSIYMTALGLEKLEFMGTTAWYFFIVNTAKIPIYLLLTALAPDQPMFNAQSLAFDAILLPLVVAGVFVGRWSLHRIPQRAFTWLVLVLAAIAAARLIAG